MATNNITVRSRSHDRHINFCKCEWYAICFFECHADLHLGDAHGLADSLFNAERRPAHYFHYIDGIKLFFDPAYWPIHELRSLGKQHCTSSLQVEK